MAPADRKRFLSNIASDAARLNLLVSRLLDLARADMATAEEGARTDVVHVMRCIADAYGHEGAALDVRISEHPVPLVAMPSNVLEAVLAGLIENSKQAGATQVTLAARSAPAGVTVIVTDDGPGVPLGDHHRIFEPFFTTRRSDGGTGLGLPILRSLLDANRGTIDLDAAYSRGASFVISLPAKL